MSDRDQPPHVRRQQEVLNHHWPADPQALRTREPGIPVRVRVVWNRDGETYVDGVARRWDANHVYVEIRDPRSQNNGVWVKPHDVYRRSPAARPRQRDSESAAGDVSLQEHRAERRV